MATRTMAAAGGGGNGGSMQRPHIQGLARQNSLYGLTLNEVQNHLGEPLHSMNLDELLKTVFPFSEEANQIQELNIKGFTQHTSGSAPQSQEKNITMPGSLSKRTVDEVWRDIQQGRQMKGPIIDDRRIVHEKQPTLGEMTLEDFLIKAGVVTESSATKHKTLVIGNVGGMAITNPLPVGHDFAQRSHWPHQYHQMPQGIDQQKALEAYEFGRSVGPMLESAVYPDSQVKISSPTIEAFSDTHLTGRKRVASVDLPDKLVERRQKRMIKNRESAARSRARKQAYTHELENKVSRLEEENKRLKRQKDLDRIIHYAALLEPKYRLRRTSSALF